MRAANKVRRCKMMFLLICSCVVAFLMTAWLLDVGLRWNTLQYSAFSKNPLSCFQQAFLPITQHPTASQRTLSMLIAERVRVFCLIHTSPTRHSTLASAVNITWAAHCNDYVLISTEDDPTLPNLVKQTGLEAGREHMWSRTKAALRFVYDHHIDDFDWFMRVDDDAYLILENLRFFLLTYDPDDKIYQGCRLKNHQHWPHLDAGYMQGGVGYVLSRAALRAFIDEGLKSGKCNEILYNYPFNITTNDTSDEDVEIGGCFEKLGVMPGDSRDAAGKQRFIPQPASSQLGYPTGIAPRQNWVVLSWYPYMMGSAGVSDYCIGFHHLSASEIRMLDFLIYRLRPYGADLAVDSDICDSAVNEDALMLAAYQASAMEIGPDDLRKKNEIKAFTALPNYLRAKNGKRK